MAETNITNFYEYDRLTDALERLTTIQKSKHELNQEASKIRRHIKDFDVNVDALDFLANARSKDKEGGGAQLVNDVTEYAHIAGIQTTLAGLTEHPSPREGSASTEHSSDLKSVQEIEKRSIQKLLMQCVASAIITICLFQLIH